MKRFEKNDSLIRFSPSFMPRDGGNSYEEETSKGHFPFFFFFFIWGGFVDNLILNFLFKERNKIIYYSISYLEKG